MKKRNNILAILLTAGVVLVISGCGTTDTAQDNKIITDEAEQAELVKAEANEVELAESVQEEYDTECMIPDTGIRSTREIIENLLENYTPDGEFDSALEAVTHQLYVEAEEMKSTDKNVGGVKLDFDPVDVDDEIFYGRGVELLTWEECQSVEYKSFDYVSTPIKHYLIPFVNYTEKKLYEPFMAVIPKGYAKMEDLTITKDSISGPMEWKGVKFNFCMKVITEDECGEISDWENYVYNLYVDESKNIRDIRKYDSLSASLESIGIYDTIVGDVYTRNIIETERLYIEDFNGAVCYEISIPMHYNDDPDSIINEEQCISLIKTFGKQNCDYYDIVRCWNYFGIKETIIPKAYEEVNFETPAEEAIVN